MCNAQMRNVMKNQGFGSTGVRGLGNPSALRQWSVILHNEPNPMGLCAQGLKRGSLGLTQKSDDFY
jgi:hypothetical protein